MLIVGGYGTFGGRLARLLADVAGLTVLIAGRSLERAQEFCSREGTAACQPARFDRDAPLEEQLRVLQPDLVVDASGPFQAYGERPYRLVEACLDCGVHYLDLADSTDFVCGVERFDARARERGVFVLSGVSTCPALTSAVVRALSAGMTRVDAITGGIAPSPFANVGLNVIRALAGYAGKPLRLSGVDGGASARSRRAGDGSASTSAQSHRALIDTFRYTISVPGCVPLQSRMFSLVDVPDLELLPTLRPECRSVWLGAGPVPAIWHRLFRGFAWLVRLRLLSSLTFLAPAMYHTTNRFRWGEHRGGMFVRLEGTDATGARAVRSFHLIAEGDAGPYIPSMAAAAIISKCRAGALPAAGARPAIRDLEVSDYEPLFARHSIRFGMRDDTVTHQPLYQRILGPAWDALPESLRAMHSVLPGAAHGASAGHGTSAGYGASTYRGKSTALAVQATSLMVRGRATVTRGTGWLAARVASLIGFPQPGSDVPVEVRFDVTPSRETWTRTFAGRPFVSEQFAGTGRFDRLICERFGPLTIALAVVVERAPPAASDAVVPTLLTSTAPRAAAVTGYPRLRLIVRGWSFLGIPMPRALAPACDAHEHDENGRFHFDVAISHRWTGLIVHYRGSLAR